VGQLRAHRALSHAPDSRNLGHVKALEREERHVAFGRRQGPGLKLPVDDIRQRPSCDIQRQLLASKEVDRAAQGQRSKQHTQDEGGGHGRLEHEMDGD